MLLGTDLHKGIHNIHGYGKLAIDAFLGNVESSSDAWYGLTECVKDGMPGPDAAPMWSITVNAFPVNPFWNK